MAGAPIAEMLLAQDDPAGAFELVERVLPVNAVDPRVLDELMVSGPGPRPTWSNEHRTTATRPPYRPIGRP